MLFATLLSQFRRLAPPSVSSYMAAVRCWHINLGAPDPSRGTPRLVRLLRYRPPPLLLFRLMGVLFSALCAPSLRSFDHVMFWAFC